MMPVEIDPSEVRGPRKEPHESVRARLGRPAMLAALAVVGVGGCAGLAAAAYPTISDMLRPRPPQVHFGRVADMPEIKDGIPALRTTPVRQVPIVQVPIVQAPSAQAPVSQAPMTQAPMTQPPMSQAPMASAVPRLTPPSAPAALLDPKPTAAPGALAQGSAVKSAPGQGSWSPASDVAATGTAAFQPVAAIPKAQETSRPAAAPREAKVNREAKATGEAVTPRAVPVARESAPLPPARAVEAKPESRPVAPPRQAMAEPKATPRPAPAREAKAEPAKAEPVRQAAEKAVAEKRPAEKHAAEKPVARREKPEAHQRSAAAQPVAVPEEPARFLGVPMPDLAPAGRAIRETVDAVISLPSRL